MGLGYWYGMPKEGSGGGGGNSDGGKENGGGKEETTPEEPEFLKQGLVAYYPFNGNAKDESGNGNDGKNSGATLTSDRRGMPDKAYAFEEGAISLPRETMKGGDKVSVFAWINVETGTQGMYPRLVGGNTSGLVNVWLGLANKNSKELSIEVDTPASNRLQGHGVIENGIWFHVALVYDGSELAEYVNGIKKASKAVSGNYPQQINIKIGGIGRYLFRGKIDDVRIYNRALTEAEVKALYEFEKPKSSKHPRQRGPLTQATHKTS